MPNLTSTFSLFGLPWEHGDYLSTTFEVTPTWLQNVPELAEKYSVKAQHLKHVEARDCVYLPAHESRVQSHVFPAISISKKETPLAIRQVDKGYLCYVGDVNWLHSTTKVIIALSKWRLQSILKGMRKKVRKKVRN